MNRAAPREACPTTLAFPPPLDALLREVGVAAARRGAKAWAVGGVARDAILGHPNKDVDITVEGDAPAVASDLAMRWGAEMERHAVFSTATLRRADGYIVDVVRARSETYPAPGALPVIVPDALAADLPRRDFSINAMAVSLNAADFGALVDPVGGFADMQARTLRVLHPGSFLDDPTRLFRAARYVVRYDLTAEPRTDALARAAVTGGALETVSWDRLGREVDRLCRERRWAAALEWLNGWNVWTALHGAEVSANLLRRADTVLAWAARSVSEPAPDIAHFRRLAFLRCSDARLWVRLSVRPRDAATMEMAQYDVLESLSEPEMPKWWRRMDELGLTPLLLALCLVGSDSEKRRLTRYIADIRPLRLSIGGGDLLGAGAESGPGIGVALRETLDAVRLGHIHGEEAERDHALRVWNSWKARAAG